MSITSRRPAGLGGGRVIPLIRLGVKSETDPPLGRVEMIERGQGIGAPSARRSDAAQVTRGEHHFKK